MHRLHATDLQAGFGRVLLPDALGQLLEGIEGLSKWRNHAYEGPHYAQAMLDMGVAPEGVPSSERSDERQSSQAPLENIARKLPTPGTPLQNCQEPTREQLVETLRVTLREVLEFNRRDANERGYEFRCRNYSQQGIPLSVGGFFKRMWRRHLTLRATARQMPRLIRDVESAQTRARGGPKAVRRRADPESDASNPAYLDSSVNAP